jgi:hypothetical protein
VSARKPEKAQTLKDFYRKRDEKIYSEHLKKFWYVDKALAKMFGLSVPRIRQILKNQRK